MEAMDGNVAFGAAMPFSEHAYALDSTEFTLIDTVKGLISDGSYRELFTLDNHLSLLEGVKRKLSMIAAGEAHSGFMNWGLRETLYELRELLNSLRELRQRLFLAL